MNKFLKRYNSPKITQKMDNLSRPVSIKLIESINNLPEQKAPGPNGLVNSTKHERKKLYLFSISPSEE